MLITVARVSMVAMVFYTIVKLQLYPKVQNR